jgi:hypothetical protein
MHIGFTLPFILYGNVFQTAFDITIDCTFANKILTTTISGMLTLSKTVFKMTRIMHQASTMKSAKELQIATTYQVNESILIYEY